MSRIVDIGCKTVEVGLLALLLHVGEWFGGSSKGRGDMHCSTGILRLLQSLPKAGWREGSK